jgi:hypothetical protein
MFQGDSGIDAWGLMQQILPARLKNEPDFAMPTITVTEDDITIGKPGDTKICPVARAAARALNAGAVGAISVGGFQIIYWPDPDTAMIYNLPGRAQAWIAAFDRGESIRPISFDIAPANEQGEE